MFVVVVLFAGLFVLGEKIFFQRAEGKRVSEGETQDQSKTCKSARTYNRKELR